MSAEFIFSIWLFKTNAYLTLKFCFTLEFFNGSTWRIMRIDITNSDTFPKWATSPQLLETDRIPVILFARATPKISITHMNTAIRIYHTPTTPLLAVEAYLISYRSHWSVSSPQIYQVKLPIKVLASTGSHVLSASYKYGKIKMHFPHKLKLFLWLQ